MNASARLSFLAADHRLEGRQCLQAALANLAEMARFQAPAEPEPVPFFADAQHAALCAVAAGAELDMHVGLRFDGEPIPAGLVGSFLSARFGTNMGNKSEGSMVLLAARGLSVLQEHAEAIAEMCAILQEACHAHDSMIDPFRLADLKISEVLRRLQAKKNPLLS